MVRGISTVIPAFNEGKSLSIILPQIIAELEKTGEHYEIIVVDSHSKTDDTESVCLHNGAVYCNQPGKGFADAIRYGISLAGMDKLLMLDADGSHDPGYILKIFDKFVSDKCDVVIGSRYAKGGKTNDSAINVFMSRLLNLVYSLGLGIKAKDMSTNFRMYDSAQIKAVELKCENFDVLEEILLKLKLNNRALKIGEVPIIFKKRISGSSKRRLGAFIKSYISTFFSLFTMRIRAKRSVEKPDR